MSPLSAIFTSSPSLWCSNKSTSLALSRSQFFTLVPLMAPPQSDNCPGKLAQPSASTDPSFRDPILALPIVEHHLSAPTPGRPQRCTCPSSTTRSPTDLCPTDLIHYYSGTTGWINISSAHGTIKRLVKHLPCLSTICSLYAKLPTAPSDGDHVSWSLQLTSTQTCKVTEARPSDLRFTLHPDHHWVLSPPLPPQRIPFGWRLPSRTWRKFWQIKLPHRATTI
ncbi:hypothetical protein, partial, partial [Absidia glauca]